MTGTMKQRVALNQRQKAVVRSLMRARDIQTQAAMHRKNKTFGIATGDDYGSLVWQIEEYTAQKAESHLGLRDHSPEFVATTRKRANDAMCLMKEAAR